MFGLLLERIQQFSGGILPIPLWIVANPFPKIRAGLFHGKFRLPVKDFVCQRRIGGEIEHVSLSSFDDLVREVTTNNGAERLDDLEHGATAPRAQVDGLDAGMLLAEVVEGDEVTLGEVENVDVVSDGGAVSGGVIWIPVLVNCHLPFQSTLSHWPNDESQPPNRKPKKKNTYHRQIPEADPSRRSQPFRAGAASCRARPGGPLP